MKKVFTLVMVLGFLLIMGSLASANEISVDFSGSHGIAVANEPEQYRINGISVEIIDVNGTKTVFYDVIFQWSTNQCALIPIEVIEVTQPIVPKECDNAFWRILHKKECAGWVDPNDPGSGWTCPYKLGHHSYCTVCEENDNNRDGTDGCDAGEGWCAPNRGHCAQGLVCDEETHKCVKP